MLFLLKKKYSDNKEQYVELLRHYLKLKYPARIDIHLLFNRLLLLIKSLQILQDDILHIIASVPNVPYSPFLVQLLNQPNRKQFNSSEEQSNCNIDRLYQILQSSPATLDDSTSTN